MITDYIAHVFIVGSNRLRNLRPISVCLRSSTLSYKDAVVASPDWCRMYARTVSVAKRLIPGEGVSMIMCRIKQNKSIREITNATHVLFCQQRLANQLKLYEYLTLRPGNNYAIKNTVIILVPLHTHTHSYSLYPGLPVC